MTCKELLLDYLKQNKGWHKKVSLYVIAEDWSPETVGRDLRALQESGEIQVGYYDGKISKGLAKYAFEKQPELKTKVELVDGIARVTQYYE